MTPEARSSPRPALELQARGPSCRPTAPPVYVAQLPLPQVIQTKLTISPPHPPPSCFSSCLSPGAFPLPQSTSWSPLGTQAQASHSQVWMGTHTTPLTFLQSMVSTSFQDPLAYPNLLLSSLTSSVPSTHPQGTGSQSHLPLQV